jgi:Flp pilus assembly protein TadD
MSRSSIAVVLCAAALALAGCAGTATTPDTAKVAPVQAQPADKLLADAEGDIAVRRFQLAQQRLARLDGPAAGTPRAQFAAAEVLLGLERPKEALAKYQALQSDPTYGARAWQGMGLSLMALNDVTAAQLPLQKAVAMDSKLWRAWMALGRAYDQERRWTDAQDAYDKALAANPDAAMVLNNIGMSQLLQHRYAEAAGTFQRALDADPGLDIARANLRIALAWQGRYDEALVGADSSGRSDTLNNIGYIAMLRGDYQAAQKYLAQAMDGSPTYHVQAAGNLDMLRLLVKSQAAKAEQGATSTPPPAP